MDILQTLKEIGQRNNGDVYLGIVGPVRVGKSTFIKRFMETVILDNIQDPSEKQRTLDEIPQSGSGKTIMTTEPKFVPSNGVNVMVDDNLYVKVRLIDCVGFIIDEASGYLEDGKMRMVKTPWFNEAIPFDDAARIGTEKVIKDHSTLGIVVLSDGSVTSFSRNSYIESEKRVLEEMKAINKPFVIVLNTNMPSSSSVIELKKELENKYECPVIPLDVLQMKKEDATLILRTALEEFPLDAIEVALPNWVSSLDSTHYIKESLKNTLNDAMNKVRKVKDVNNIINVIEENEYVNNCSLIDVNTGSGIVTIKIMIKEELYNQILEELVGCKIQNKGELIKVLQSFAKAKKEYDMIGGALEMANATGYGFSSSSMDDLKIEKPIQTKNQGKYGIKVKANTSTYHIIKVDVSSSFDPILGSKDQADYFIDYLTKAYDKSELDLLECEMFGRKFKDIINESITMKLNSLPEPVKNKICLIIKNLSNKGKSNLIAFVF